MLGLPLVRATAVTASISLLLAQTGAGQSPADGEVRFRVQANTVLVDVIVTDNKGNIVPGLTANDFRISENGVAQKILGFEPPPAVTKGRAPAENTASTSVGGASSAAARLHLVTLVVDLGDTQMQGLLASIKALKDYVQKSITDDDYVALYAIGTGLRLVVPYTKNKARLLDEIGKLNKQSNQGIFTGRDRDRALEEIARLQSDEAQARASKDQASAMLGDMIRTERLAMMTQMSFQNTFQARSVFQGLRAIAISAGMLPGRKNVILFSEGFMHSDDAEDAMNAVISAANRSNVAFYVVDPSAMGSDRNFSGGSSADNATNEAPAGAGMGRVPNSRSTQNSEFARMGPTVVGGRTKFDMAKQAMALDSKGSDMGDIASATGGFMVKGGSALTSLDRIDRDLREHYTLTYQSSNPALDGTFRAIKVEVEGKGYRVRSRKGYFAMLPGDEIKLTPAGAQLVASAASGNLQPSVGIKLNAALVLERKDEHAVPFSVWLPNDTSWATADPVGGYSTQIDVVVTARNAEGRLVEAYQQKTPFQATKDQWKNYEKFGVQLMASLSVPKMEPLEIQAIVSFTNGKTGLVKTRVVVPGEADSGVRPTSLVLASQVEMAKKNSEPVIPALRLAEYDVILPKDTQFSPTGKLTLYFGLANVTIEAASGRPLLGLALAIKSGSKVIRELPALDGLYPWPQSNTRLFFLKQFDLAGLAPGSYSIEATVKDRSKNTTLTQSAPFVVQ